MARNIQARRKLGDLYRVGTEVRFGPDGGRVGREKPPYFDDPVGEDEIAVWVQAPNPLQRGQASSEAQAARARAMIKTKRDEESEEHLTSMAFLADMSHETLIDYVLLGEQDDRRGEAIRDVLARDEWKDIVELQDVMRQFDEEETPEDDPEYEAVMVKDREYGRQVGERFEQLTEAARESLRMLAHERLEKRALERRSELVGSQRFMDTFELYMTYYSVRDIDAHDVLFFDSPREFQEQDDIVQTTIKEAIATFIENAEQAKNSSGAVPGSPSSVPPSAPETSESSTPEAVSA